MYSALFTLLNRLDRSVFAAAGVIPWGAPVPSFGDPSTAKVATLGLNPSNREFVDELGNELDGPDRRFHTLRSLRIRSWAETEAKHIDLILESCRSYFHGNPYNRWFKVLDNVVKGADASYYDVSANACHLDLIPYATASKWAELTGQQRKALLEASADSLGLLLRDSPIRVLILNGRSVVEHLETCSGIRLDRKKMMGWTLPRQSGQGVVGIAYRGWLSEIAGVSLHRRIAVLGFNHNLQSSFGVTKAATDAIKYWIAECSAEVAR
jgi:hypothetical protein